MLRMDEWFWRELREGGYLHGYIAREKARADRDLRKVAIAMDGFKQNNKSDWRLLAAVPARNYHRWQQEDRHFWDDNANLRSYRRDNPDARVYL